MALGLLIVRRSLAQLIKSTSWPVIGAVSSAIVLGVAAIGALTFYSDRAVAINRALSIDPRDDLRNLALPTVVSMVKEYFPVGSGLGGFDTVFRLHEPFDLLRFTFFHRAHNDFAELILDAGVLGAMMLIAALGFWLRFSVKAWRAPAGPDFVLPRVASTMLLLIFLASIVDYPARTPFIMAVVVVSAYWLSKAGQPTPISRHLAVTKRASWRSTADRNSLARWPKFALALLTIFAGYFGTTFSIAQVLAPQAPRLAYTLAPYDGRLAASLAAELLNDGADATERGLAVRLAKLALRRDATAIKAVGTLGLDAQLRGNDAMAIRLFSYIEKLSRRDVTAQLWWIEYSVAHEDISGALRHYDTALRTAPGISDTLFPILAPAAVDPNVRRELLKVLKAKPRWTSDFVQFFAANIKEPQAVFQFYTGLSRIGIRPPDLPRAQAINVLVDAGKLDDAWALYRTWNPGAARGTVNFARFKGNPEIASKLDWLLINDGTTSTSLQESGAGGVVDFTVPPNTATSIMQQSLLLPTGSYRLSGHGGAGDPGVPPPYWRLACEDGRELARISTSRNGAKGVFAGTFAVPGNCTVQLLTLMSQSVDTPSGLAGQISEVFVEKLP